MKKLLRPPWTFTTQSSANGKNSSENSPSSNPNELPRTQPSPLAPRAYIAYRPVTYQPAYIPREYSSPPPKEARRRGASTLHTGPRINSSTSALSLAPQRSDLSVNLSPRSSKESSGTLTPSGEPGYHHIHRPPPLLETSKPPEKLLCKYNPESAQAYLTKFARKTHALVNIPRPRILGLAPSLHMYGLLWEIRYTLEIQLPHFFSKFRARFRWPGMPEGPISGEADEKELVEELIEVIGLSVYVLWMVWADGHEEARRGLRLMAEWMEVEVNELVSDWRRYRVLLEQIGNRI